MPKPLVAKYPKLFNLRSADLDNLQRLRKKLAAKNDYEVIHHLLGGG